MALDRITCPECGAGLKSKTGFTVGKTVNCPKCETAFTVEDPDEEGEEEAEEVKPVKKKPAKAAVEDDDEGEEDAPKKKKRKKKKKKSADDEDEWSYKKSWIRYAVLGVLLIVLGVLVYFLYEKKKKEAARADPVPAAVTRTAAAAG